MREINYYCNMVGVFCNVLKIESLIQAALIGDTYSRIMTSHFISYSRIKSIMDYILINMWLHIIVVVSSGFLEMLDMQSYLPIGTLL